MSNVKILRLNNCGNNPKVIQDTDKSGFKYIVEQDLINNGRCLVEVISGWSQITQQTISAGGAITATTRIVPNNVPQLVIRSNILQEGEDTLTGGGGLILGTMSLQNLNTVSSTNSALSTNSAFFNQNDSLSFVCERLPSSIHIQRLFWSQDPSAHAHIPVLLPADGIATGDNKHLIPFEVVLKITFIDVE